MSEPTPPATPPAEDTPAHARHARIGLILFAIYLLLYAGFVAINAFRPDLAGRRLVAGVNLAILYGLGLIVAAIVLAVLYMLLARPLPSERSDDQTTMGVAKDGDR